jgi:hypothetical protein
MYFWWFPQVPLRRSHLTYQTTGCHVPEAMFSTVNPLKPNDQYSGRTAPLTTKLCILYIYSTNIGTEYFKHGIYSPFFSLQNAVYNIFGSCIIHILYTGVLKLKK